MRESKDHMEIRGVNDLGPARVHPDFPGESLAVWTIAVTAGIIMELCMSAVVADGDVTAKSLRLTAHERVSGFALDMGQGGAIVEVIVIGKPENLLDGKVRQGCRLPTGQTD